MVFGSDYPLKEEWEIMKPEIGNGLFYGVVCSSMIRRIEQGIASK